MNPSDIGQFLLALCLWREARGESLEAKRAIAHVILNRVKARFRGSDLESVILWPAQFSSFLRNDPNSTQFPKANDASWADCCTVSNDPGEDPTHGALMYHSGPMPGWALPQNQVARIGAFRFYSH